MSELQAADVARACWGIAGVTADRLASEHDDAFRLTLPDGSRRFLRVSAPDAGFLTAILLHLAQNDSVIPVQRVEYTPSGAAEVLLDDGRLARMTTFLDGRLLADVPSAPALRRTIGATLAQLSRALRSFRHPGARRTHLWDLQNAHALRPLLEELAPRGVRGVVPPGGIAIDPTVRGRLTQVLDRFDSVVRPALAEAATQVIHTDFHGENLLVSEDGTTISGILDFGDSLTGPVAMDVAVAACYQLGAGGPADGLAGRDLLAPALDVVAGYHAVDPLRPADLPLIGELILLRLATRVIVSQWNAAREPSNSGYLLRRTGQAVDHFGEFGKIPADDVVNRLRTACGLEASA